METRLLGRYRLLAELGRGAMGTVYRAADPLIERDVAIKTLHPNLPEELMHEVRERFLREAKSAGRLNHPNIVTIYDVGEQGDIAYIAMELLEGRSLQKMLRDPERLSFHLIAELAAQVADGLDHAQRFTIVHRDVKPANVMVSPAGRAKLTDFGVAYVPSSTMTQTGMAIGSPKYMSPEQVLALPVDPRSDIFSLGVVLYEMLTRRTPFERPGETHLFALMNRIARDPYQPVTQLDPAIPAAFDRVLARALAKNPNERYSRAGDMANDLRNLRNLGTQDAAGAGRHEDSTLVLTGARKSGNASAPRARFPGAAPTAAQSPSGTGASGPDFLADLDAFSRKLDEEQKAHEAEQRRRREEEEARRKAEEEARRKAEAERTRRAQAERQGEGRRSAALDMLRKQAAASRPAAEGAASRRAEAKALLSKNLRSTMHYLAEFAKELNAALPTTEAPYEFIYLQRPPQMVLSKAFADYRLRKVDGDEVCDHVFLNFQARYAQPAVVDVSGPDVENCRRFLSMSRIPFEFSATKKDDFGQAVRGTFTLSGIIPCELYIRADYDTSSALIELLNVGRIGTGRCRLAPEALTERLADEIAKHALGSKNEFAKLMTR
jgi:serine/threonine protein kinase